MKIAIIEDHQQTNDTLKEILELNNHNVITYYNIKSFLKDINKLNVDIIIADINLPDGNFLEELNKYPDIANISKILIVSAHTEIESIKKSFNLGAEDFIKKPFDYEEIELRINKIFPKNKNYKINKNIIYDTKNKTLLIDNEKIDLTKKESQILEILLQERGKIVPQDIIMKKVWGEMIAKNTLIATIKRLRKKFKNYHVIKTKKNLGYYIELSHLNNFN